MPDATKIDVEAFTLAKDPETPSRNEDRYVVIPGRAYAVIDGVSDKTGLRHQGLTGGQLAGRMVEEVIRRECDRSHPETIDGVELAECFEKRFQRVHDDIRRDNTNKTPPNLMFGAQLALALQGTRSFRFILIGDSGLRLNGREVFWANHPLDAICSAIRKAVWGLLTEHGVPAERKHEIARAYTVEGLGAVLKLWADHIDGDALVRLRQTVFDSLNGRREEVDAETLKRAIRGGLREQSLYINRHHPLGYPCINGFPIPSDFIVQFDREIEDVETIELFSDGYFGYPEGTRIADWEDRLARIEATDPEKIGDHASTKGSSNGRFSDDRTILIARRDPRNP